MLLQGKSPPESSVPPPLASFRSSNLQHPSVFISDGCHRTYCKLTDSTLQKLLMPQVSGPEAQQCQSGCAWADSSVGNLLPFQPPIVLYSKGVLLFTHISLGLFSVLPWCCLYHSPISVFIFPLLIRTAIILGQGHPTVNFIPPRDAVST